MRRSSDRILTTHVGTLPQPRGLTEAASQRDSFPAEYDALLRKSVTAVVSRQAEIGVDVIDDGEFSKTSWTAYVNDRLHGFEQKPAADGFNLMQISQDRRDFPAYYEEATKAGSLWYRPLTTAAAVESPPRQSMQWVCTSEVTYSGQQILKRDIDNFKAALDEASVEEAFLPVAAPASVEPGRRNEYYPSEKAYIYALAEAMREEYKAIAEAGLLVQLDDAWIPALWDRMLPNVDAEQYRDYCMLRVEAMNHALRDISEDRVRYHICWGSWHAPHTSDIPMKDLLPVVLQVKAGAYLFEAANVRHEHEYHLWDDVKFPEGKILIPGVVSHATNVVEHEELVAERIIRFAERVGRENVMAGTDCGLGGRVHPEIAWAKLKALVSGARLASEQLWR